MDDLIARIANVESERDELLRARIGAEFSMRRLQETYIEAQHRLIALSAELDEMRSAHSRLLVDVERQRQIRADAEMRLTLLKKVISDQNDLIDAVLDEFRGGLRGLLGGLRRSESLEALKAHAVGRQA